MCNHSAICAENFLVEVYFDTLKYCIVLTHTQIGQSIFEMADQTLNWLVIMS